ncbi:MULTISPECIES: carbohydrate ABC transporter permease [Oceanotoga]|uniref:ABC-type sugar transport system permease subunit n=1 Tax=Oceanotoga teriensis TaxID=515440 RepID=A0AA45C6G1_9BACT|nr:MULTISPECIES: sugar ABC transporter permease [Oceanotoga]MDN5341997.1 hypothetical protein [Oceanotoga sp.]MDO7976044.1 sugar ABC transporter permease [Oceanotoga teriensis]PWJ92089.1 ABC-type sugar transport system permease subunit [Oceanotoga teriensis]
MKNYKENFYGYLFISPVIILLITFMLYPIMMTFIYSFTDYNSTKNKQFEMPIIPEDSIQFYIGEFIDDIKKENLNNYIDSFNMLDFIQNELGIKLNDKQIKIIKNSKINIEKLFEDFYNRELSSQTTVKKFLNNYINGASSAFKYKPKFIGLDNYIQAYNDEYFWIALGNALLFCLIVVPIQTFLALLLAIASNQKIHGINFFKASFFIPSITSSAAISMIFSLIYSKAGILNRMLGIFGIPQIDWLNNPTTALGAIMAMNIWTTAGYFMITYLAGLQNIPNELYEAAKIDGAKNTTMFFKIIIPLLKNQSIYVITIGIISTLQVFDQIYMLIKNLRNITLSFYIYKNAFEYGQMGYASTLGVILFFIVLIITSIFKKTFKEESVI